MNAINLLVTDSHCQYVPEVFARNFDLTLWSGVDQDDVDIILKGPHNNDEYWDAWDYILTHAVYYHQGNVFYLHQDGDLFAVCDDLMTEDEYINFFGFNKQGYEPSLDEREAV